MRLHYKSSTSGRSTVRNLHNDSLHNEINKSVDPIALHPLLVMVLFYNVQRIRKRYENGWYGFRKGGGPDITHVARNVLTQLRSLLGGPGDKGSQVTASMDSSLAGQELI